MRKRKSKCATGGQGPGTEGKGSACSRGHRLQVWWKWCQVWLRGQAAGVWECGQSDLRRQACRATGSTCNGGNCHSAGRDDRAGLNTDRSCQNQFQHWEAYCRIQGSANTAHAPRFWQAGDPAIWRLWRWEFQCKKWVWWKLCTGGRRKCVSALDVLAQAAETSPAKSLVGDDYDNDNDDDGSSAADADADAGGADGIVPLPPSTTTGPLAPKFGQQPVAAAGSFGAFAPQFGKQPTSPANGLFGQTGAAKTTAGPAFATGGLNFGVPAAPTTGGFFGQLPPKTPPKPASSPNAWKPNVPNKSPAQRGLNFSGAGDDEEEDEDHDSDYEDLDEEEEDDDASDSDNAGDPDGDYEDDDYGDGEDGGEAPLNLEANVDDLEDYDDAGEGAYQDETAGVLKLIKEATETCEGADLQEAITDVLKRVSPEVRAHVEPLVRSTITSPQTAAPPKFAMTQSWGDAGAGSDTPPPLSASSEGFGAPSFAPPSGGFKVAFGKPLQPGAMFKAPSPAPKANPTSPTNPFNNDPNKPFTFAFNK